MADNTIYIPQYLTGEDLTYVALYVATRNPNGTWNNTGQTLSLTHTLERIEVAETIEHQDIRAVNRRVINNVITGDGFGLNAVEILKSDLNYANILPMAVVLGNYFRFIFAAGWDFWDLFVVRGALRYGVTDHGLNTCELPTLPMDVGYPSNAAYGFQSQVPPPGS